MSCFRSVGHSRKLPSFARAEFGPPRHVTTAVTNGSYLWPEAAGTLPKIRSACRTQKWTVQIVSVSCQVCQPTALLLFFFLFVFFKQQEEEEW